MQTLDFFKKYRKKKVTMLWSGGLDSNTLLYGLMAVKADVRLLNIVGDCLISKRPEHLMMDHIEQVLDVKRTTVKLSGPVTANSLYSRSQIVLWLSTLALNCRPDDDYVMAAYVMTDEAISFLPEIKEHWNSLAPFVTYGRKLPTYEAPLSKLLKREIEHINKDLLEGLDTIPRLNHVYWSCEADSHIYNIPIRCGKCHSCKVEEHNLDMSHDALVKRYLLTFDTLAALADFSSIEDGKHLYWSLEREPTSADNYHLYIKENGLSNSRAVHVGSLHVTIGDVTGAAYASKELIKYATQQAKTGKYPMHYYLPINKIAPLTDDVAYGYNAIS